MNDPIKRYQFPIAIPTDDINFVLTDAVNHIGNISVRCIVNPDLRMVWIDTSTPAGVALNDEFLRLVKSNPRLAHCFDTVLNPVTHKAYPPELIDGLRKKGHNPDRLLG